MNRQIKRYIAQSLGVSGTRESVPIASGGMSPFLCICQPGSSWKPVISALYGGFPTQSWLILRPLSVLLPSLESENFKLLITWMGLPQWLSGKESACSAGDAGDVSSIPGQRVRHDLATKHTHTHTHTHTYTHTHTHSITPQKPTWFSCISLVYLPSRFAITFLSFWNSKLGICILLPSPTPHPSLLATLAYPVCANIMLLLLCSGKN